MKILLFGVNGQVGWELQRSLAPLGQLRACDRRVVDFENIDSLRDSIREYSPNVIVNAAAYTAVDKAETEPEKAYRINAEAVGLLANEAKLLDAWLIHYSTDYLFDGAKPDSYVETDPPNPLNVYGKTKLQGEGAVVESGCKHLIFRTSWVYASRGANFAKTVLRLAAEREEIKMIADQIGAPTSAELIADVTALALHRIKIDTVLAEKASGVYNLTASGDTNWHKYAKLVIRTALQSGVPLKAKPDSVTPIPSYDYPMPATRPLNSRANTQKLSDTFSLHLPPWHRGVVRMLEEVLALETRYTEQDAQNKKCGVA